MAESPPVKNRYSSSLSPERGKDDRSRSRSRSPPRRSDRSDRGDRGGDRSDRSDRGGGGGGGRERDRERRKDAINPGNNLYVTGLSTRVNEKDLEEHFSQEGKVLECRLVLDPRTRESRGFGFVTMEHLEEAERCIKYLNRSTLEGRIITVEKAKRKRARTPTPGEYLGVRAMHSNRRGGRSGGGYHRDGRSHQRHSPEYLPYAGERGRSPRYSPYRQRDRSMSPQYAPYRR